MNSSPMSGEGDKRHGSPLATPFRCHPWEVLYIGYSVFFINGIYGWHTAHKVPRDDLHSRVQIWDVRFPMKVGLSFSVQGTVGQAPCSTMHGNSSYPLGIPQDPKFTPPKKIIQNTKKASSSPTPRYVILQNSESRIHTGSIHILVFPGYMQAYYYYALQQSS